jgi:hypothetical protein
MTDIEHKLGKYKDRDHKMWRIYIRTTPATISLLVGCAQTVGRYSEIGNG